MDFVILSFASILVIVDPVSLIPTFLAMTPRNTVPERIRLAGLASLFTFMILLITAIAGERIFKIFGITLSAFEIAGGVILLLIALDMLRGHQTEVRASQEEQEEGTEKDNIAVTPLAMPMLAGPGAMTTVILLASRAETWTNKAILVGNIFIISMLTFGILYFAAIRSSHISVIALKITSRFMGLILSSIAIQFILNGIRTARLFA